ncbi:MAG TPA: hypothetical protein EYQ86_02410, partial [Bacteroidetes bacterium]|nr:hypothetical protein [Bacteroidota bacterium]
MYNKYLIISFIFFISCSDYEPIVYKKEGNKGYVQWLANRRNDPKTSRINWGHYSKARNEAISHKRDNTRELMEWSELGPTNWGGRTRAFMIDKDDPNKLYAGSVSGGLWSSDDAGMSWYHLTKLDECITVASICQTINGDIYVGTGEGMYGNYGEATGGLPGNGIYKSIDGGQSFFHLDSTSVLINDIDTTWAHVNRLAAHPIDPYTLYAATEKGIWKTTDGGIHWFHPNGLEYEAPASDVEYAKDGSYILAVVNSNYYRSENGIDFQDLTGSSILSVNNVGRIEFAIAPSDANYAYASIVSTLGKLRGIYQSKDRGLTWSGIAAGGGYQFDPFAYSGSAYGQGVYDNAIGVSLNDPEKIFVGGIRLYSWSATDGWNKIASTSLSDITYFVHSDMHWVEPHPTNPDIIYFANDGGVFKTFNGGVTFTQLTHGYATMQMYAVAVSDSGDVMGGTQDNGTHYVDYKQRYNSSSKKLLGGDGGYASFSMTRPEVFLASYQYPSLMRSINWGESFKHFWDEHISPDGEDPDGSFVTPFILWEDKGGVLIDSSSYLSLPASPDTLTHNVILTKKADTLNDPSVLYYGVNNAIWMTREVMRFDKTPVWYKV